MKKYLVIFSLVLCFLFIPKVNALNLDSYQFWAESKIVTTNGFHSFTGGTGSNFNLALLGTISDYVTEYDGIDIYVKASVCMDPVIGSQYANTDKSQYDISEFQMYQTKSKCSFTGSSYTGGRIVDTYFKIWVSDSTDSFSAYWVIYPTADFSIELISVEVNTTGFEIDYSNDTIIGQNETLIDQNTEIIQGQRNIYNQNEEAEETRKGIWETIKNLPSAFLDMLLGLFIPEDMDFLNDFVDVLEEKLGFIASIPIQLIEFITGLVSTSWETFDSISLPSISIFGYNFWNAQEIDLTEAINIFKPFKYVTDVICVVICARTLNRWRETFSGGGSGE